MTTPQFQPPQKTASTGLDFAEFDAPPEVLDELVARMIENYIPVTRENLAHALEVEQVRTLLSDEYGVRLQHEGNRSPISATRDHKGIVRLNFDQLYKLLGRERPARPGFRS